jgi:hypothetical protein
MIADEVISHLSILTNARMQVTLEIQADIPDSVVDGLIKLLTENAWAVELSLRDSRQIYSETNERVSYRIVLLLRLGKRSWWEEPALFFRKLDDSPLPLSFYLGEYRRKLTPFAT